MKIKGLWTSEYSRIATPLNIIANWRGDVINLKRSLGSAFSEFVTVFEGKKLINYERPEDLEKLYQLVAEKTLKKKWFVIQVKKEVGKAVKNLLKVSQGIYSSDLSLLGDQQLINLMDRFISAYAEIFAFGLVTSLDRDLVRIIKERLEEKFRDSKVFSEYFTVLSAPTQETIYQEEEKEILRIAIKINKNRKTKTLFKKSIPFIKKKLFLASPTLFTRLEKLTEKYCWLYVNYEGEDRTLFDFIKKIQTILFKEKIDPHSALREINKKREELIRKQKLLEKKIKSDVELVNLFQAIRQYAYLREYRKPQCVKALFYFRKLISEIAKRLKISFEETKFLLPKEIKKALLKRKLNRREVKKRTKFCVLYNNPHQEIIFSGKKAKNIIKNLKIIPKEQKDIINGIGASPGLVSGRVKIILNLKELTNFKKNDILVTKATSPEFVKIMKKATAIVTDEGGMTSHAAIISRELNIPCIVGTKVATKLLKNGDLIGVDAYNGVVKKLK